MVIGGLNGKALPFSSMPPDCGLAGLSWTEL